MQHDLSLPKKYTFDSVLTQKYNEKRTDLKSYRSRVHPEMFVEMLSQANRTVCSLQKLNIVVSSDVNQLNNITLEYCKIMQK